VANRRYVPLLEALRRQYADLADPHAAIAAGRVLVDGSVATNPTAQVGASASIRVIAPRTLRGTDKLGEALDTFGVACAGAVALDIGAAAGGFTRALLDRGARQVYAVDVGHGQLAGALQANERVIHLERTNLASLNAVLVPEPPDVVTIDVSYLSLGEAVRQLGETGVDLRSKCPHLVGLVKPMFELRLAQLPSPDEAPEAVALAAAGISAAGWSVLGTCDSSVGGANGAIEYWVHATRLL
jgi:23S rRNA (cytidine1920-2'-O)/16S rRNA (cytidine1409-2'-O)-methyltransferase